MKLKKHRTSNNEHRTPNTRACGDPFDVQCSMFSVRCFLGFLLCLIILLPLMTTHAESVVDSKHNLAVSGPGTIKAATETEVCIFCHTPHRAGPELPLWNHHTSVATYTPYNSS